MRSANTILEKGSWDHNRSVASVLLSFHDRYRRRIVLQDSNGDPFRLDLEKATVLQDGDGLLLDDGGVIAVRAAEEDVIDIHAASSSAVAKLAWHIGNRHTPLEVLPDGGLRIRHDPVLVDMIRGLGGSVTRKTAAFSPEKGAYAKTGTAEKPDHDHPDSHHHHDHHHHHHD
jgi:urease accessory protein